MGEIVKECAHSAGVDLKYLIVEENSEVLDSIKLNLTAKT